MANENMAQHFPAGRLQPGEGTAVIGRCVAAVLDFPSEKITSSPLGESLLEATTAASAADALAAHGVCSLPGFAVVLSTPTTAHILVRGRARATVETVDGSIRTLASDNASSWRETVFEDAGSLSIVELHIDGDAGSPLTSVASLGVVAARSLRLATTRAPLTTASPGPSKQADTDAPVPDEDASNEHSTQAEDVHIPEPVQADESPQVPSAPAYNFDHLLGETKFRNVEDAAVRSDAEGPEDAPRSSAGAPAPAAAPEPLLKAVRPVRVVKNKPAGEQAEVSGAPASTDDAVADDATVAPNALASDTMTFETVSAEHLRTEHARRSTAPKVVPPVVTPPAAAPPGGGLIDFVPGGSRSSMTGREPSAARALEGTKPPPTPTVPPPPPPPPPVPAPPATTGHLANAPASVPVSADLAPPPPPAPVPIPPADASNEPAGAVLQAVHCGRGHPNPAHEPACRVCAQPILDRAVRTIPRPALGLLRFSNGEVVPLDQPLIIGRKPPTHADLGTETARGVFVPDPDNGLSRTHLEVRLADWQVQLVDPGSTNHSFVAIPGREPFQLPPGQPVPITPGTTVTLGDVTSFVYAPPDP